MGNAVAGAGVLIQAEQEAQIFEANADSARQDARIAVLAASVRGENIHREAESFKGTQSAVAAANGLVSTEGSALALILRTEADATRAIKREQFAGEVEAAKYITEANIYKRQARNTRIQGAVSALAVTLSGQFTGLGGGAQPRQSAGRSGFGGSSEYNSNVESAYQSQRAGERTNYSSNMQSEF